MKADLLHKLKAQAGRLWRSQWALTLVLFLSGASLLLFRGDPFEIQELRWLDAVLRWRADIGLVRQPDPHIVHLDLGIDDLDKLPDLAQEYQNAADIIAEASELGASVIVFDIVFGRGSRESAQPILDAIERAKSRNCSVVLAEFLHGPLELKRSFPFGERLRPSGLANVQAESDGVLRRYAFVHRGPDGLEPSLALAAYLSWREIDWRKAISSPERQTVSWMELSADNSSLEAREVSVVPAILNFRSAWDASGTASFRHYTRTQLRSMHSTRQTPDPQPSPLVNSILVVSLVSSGAGDVVTTPFGSNQPGAIIHSTALNDLIQGTSITRLPPPATAAALCLILPLAWATRFCRRMISLFLMWIFVIGMILALGLALTLATNYLMGSIAVASLWTIVVLAELARRYSILKEALEIERIPRTAFEPDMTNRLTEKQESPVRLVYSYSHRDEGLRDELETH